MKVTIDITGLRLAQAQVLDAKAKFRKVLAVELQRFGDESVAHLRESIESRSLGLPAKKHGNGIPLIDSGKYLDGYLAVVEGNSLGIYSQGMNDHMSNFALAEVLEYGVGSIPPRPHIRPLAMWMQSRAHVLGERLFRGLFGD